MSYKEKDTNKSSVFTIGVRFVVTAVVLAIASYFTPGFSISGIWATVLAAVFIVLIDYFIEKAMGVDAAPFGRGLKGFLITVVILYGVQFLVSGMKVSIVGAVIAAIIIGIIDAILPVRAM